MSDLVGNPEDRFSHNEAQIFCGFFTYYRIGCDSSLIDRYGQVVGPELVKIVLREKLTTADSFKSITEICKKIIIIKDSILKV